MPSGAGTRPYRKMKRAEREEETRLRITEATVELHRTRGPAHTGIADVAKLAGVSRMTVYNHFPTEADLFAACSTHWAKLNPFPNHARWATIEDPSERLVRASKELYEWYELKKDMLSNVFRDLPVVPALEKVMAGLWSSYVEDLVRILARGWPVRGTKLKALRAAFQLVVDFNTWRILTGSGLTSHRAAELAARMVICEFRPLSRM